MMVPETGTVVVAAHANADIARFYQQLNDAGWRYYVVYEPARLIPLLSSQSIDVLVVVLPAGVENPAGHIQQFMTESSAQHIPLLVLSDVVSTALSVCCLDVGAEDCLSLSAAPALLLARLSSARARKQRRDADLLSRSRAERLANDLRLTLLPLGIALSAEKNFERLLERILWEAKRLCNADAGTLYLITDDQRLEFTIMYTDSLGIKLGGTSGRRIPFAPLPLHDPVTGEPNYHNVSTAAALQAKTIHVPDIYQSTEYDFSATRAFDSHNHYRSVSSLTVPLKDHSGGVIGVLQLLNAQDPVSGRIVPFDLYQQLVVESLSSLAAVALNNHLLLQRQRELLTLEHDMQVARKIQNGFLPDKLPQLPGWQLAARFQPAREVSGDFYDVFYISENRLGLVIADVADKGVPAALFMALVRSLIRAFAQENYNIEWMTDRVSTLSRSALPEGKYTLKNALALTNNYIAYNHASLNMFATLFFAVLEPSSGLLVYANCGHCPPVLLDAAGNIRQRLITTAPAVGLMADIPIEIERLEMRPGDTLLAYTDGVTDARTIGGAFYGEADLLELAARRYDSVEHLLNAIEESVTAHIGSAAQFDDITMLALRRVS